MCDQDNRDLVDQVVEEKIAQREIFTAFDVTRAAKDLGADERHGGMKQAIHDAFSYMQTQGYDRVQVDLNAAKGRPFVYHPKGADLTQYIADNTVGAPVKPKTQSTATATATVTGRGAVAVVPTPTLASVQPTTVNLVDLGDRTRTSSEDRLNLGRQDLKLIGALVGNTVCVSANLIPGKLVLSNRSAANDAASYVVNRDQRIRISASILNSVMTGNVYQLQHDKANKRLIVS